MPLTEIAVKEYTALITQEGTSNPIANILHNTLGTITWTRDGIGTYIATPEMELPEGKIFITCTQNYPDYQIITYWNSLTEIFINTRTTAGVASDNILINVPFKIQLYNI